MDMFALINVFETDIYMHHPVAQSYSHVARDAMTTPKPRPGVRALPGGCFEGVLLVGTSITWRSPITSTRARARRMAEAFALDLVGG